MKEYTYDEIKNIKSEGNYYSIEWRDGDSDGIIEIELGEKERFIITNNPIQITLTAFDVREKLVKAQGNSGRIYLPVQWVGKKVKVLLLE